MRLLSIAFAALILWSCGSTAQKSCDFTNCTGCCDAQGACQSGTASTECGVGGAACSACQLGEVCSFGLCGSTATGGGNGSTGGGTGGGTTGGGTGGGTTGGGTGGGTTGGGTGGGTTGGGTGGGTTGGGTGGGGGGTLSCAGTLQACSNQCVDFQADPENCGSCGQTCGQGQVCNHGQCGLLPADCTTLPQGCGAGFFCDPVTRQCQTGCRLARDCPQGATCTSGTCSCPAAQHACGQTCVSSTTTASCGTRCTPCPQPAHSTATCTTGTCGFTCDPGYREQNGTCVDIDECATNNGGCSANATCANTPGARTCTCQPGYSGDGVTCTDVNECLTANGGCDANATCTNTAGNRVCACNRGFTGDGVSCADINECLTNNGGCSANATCTNTPGSRTCTCATGFSGDGVTCTDINECLTNNGGCAATGGVCTNTPGSRTCACATGFTGNGTTCTDIDECMTNYGGCAPASSGGVCTNTPGSRTCTCAAGFSGNGTTCTDINECLTNNGGCAPTGGVCTNTSGSRTCACATGFTGNGTTCTDIDECMTNYGGCAPASSGGVCTNTPGSRTCTCAAGYSGNGMTCADVNECLTNNGGCASPGGICTNTIGSRTCACGPGFSGTGVNCYATGDVCNGAIDLAPATTVYRSTALLNYDFTGPLSALCGGDTLSGPDMVFRFTAPAYGTYSVTMNSYDGTPRVWVSSTCGSPSTCIASDPNVSVFYRPFSFYASAGQVLFIHVGSTTTPVNNFAVRVDQVTDVPGNSCSLPRSLQLNTPSTINITNATQDLDACGATTHAPDVFFSFTPSSTGTYSFVETGSVGVNLWLASSCAFSSCLAQATGVEALTATLTAGTTYYLMLEPDQPGLSASVTVVVSPVNVPFNDSCAATTDLTLATTATGTTIGATDDYAGALSAMCGGATTPGPDVVYRFVPPTTRVYRATTSSSGNASVWVSGACGVPSTCEMRNPVGFSPDWPFSFRGTAGVPVYLHVDAPSPGFPFTLKVENATAADGDLCSNAVPLTLGTTATAVWAFNAVQDVLACFPTRYNGEVFFSFTPATTGSYTFTDSSGVLVDMALSTSCTFSSCLASSSGSSQLTTTLTAGTTYYLMHSFRSAASVADAKVTVTSP
jgi:hypothetical protein